MITVLNTLSGAALCLVCASAPMADDAVAAPGPEEPLSDARIEQALAADLSSARAVDGEPLSVSVEDGVVSLEGQVDSLLARDRAVGIASATKGVRAVIDRLQLRPVEVSDEQLVDDVEFALLTDPTTDSWEIDVRCDDGQVILTGVVDSHAERNLAGTVARGVRGVRSVLNELTLHPQQERTDLDIQGDVEGRLRWNVLIDEGDVRVTVEDGVVTLEGTVGSLAQIAMARTLAEVEGVKHVDASALEVKWWHGHPMRSLRAPPTDEAVELAVRDALLHDPRVVSFRPDVHVQDGVVLMTGAVESLEARRAAAEDAMNTVGARRVINRLRVEEASGRTAPAVEEAILGALERDAVVHDESIHVTVHDGLAILEGEVPSAYERDHAEHVVAGVLGVRAIDNELVVAAELLEDRAAGPRSGAARTDGHDGDA